MKRNNDDDDEIRVLREVIVGDEIIGINFLQHYVQIQCVHKFISVFGAVRRLQSLTDSPCGLVKLIGAKFISAERSSEGYQLQLDSGDAIMVRRVASNHELILVYGDGNLEEFY